MSLDGDYLLTSRVYKVSASTDAERLPVSVRVGRDMVHETVVYPFQGTATLYNVGKLIEDGMRKTGVSSASVTITFGDSSVSKHFVYCEYAVPSSFDPAASPLMACVSRRVTEKSTVAFNCLDLGMTKFARVSVSAVCRKADGSVGPVFTDTDVSQSNCSASLHVADLIASLKSVDSDVEKVLYFTLSFSGKWATYYIVPQPPCVCFCFRNMFNAWEYVDVPGVMTRKSETSVSEAVCGDSHVQYDRKVSRQFSVATAPVPMEEVPIYEQLFSSHTIQLISGGDTPDVQITDYSSEPSSDDSSLVTFKFTFRFADRRPRVFESPVFGILPPEGGIFTEQYNYVYE